MTKVSIVFISVQAVLGMCGVCVSWENGRAVKLNYRFNNIFEKCGIIIVPNDDYDFSDS